MEYINKTDYKLGFLQENIELLVYSALAFFVPFFAGHPQFLVGTLVNASLILAAFNLKGYKLLPVIMLPSLGVLSRGIIFGPFTMFLVYMIPFIWVSNAIIVLVFKRLIKYNKVGTLITGSIAKTAFLFTAAFVLVNLEVVPVLFLTTMGVFQLYTALAGGAIALGVQFFKRKLA
ncbi:MAG: hypothetical protein KJ601_07880 [Nanoarchaeota archaeon]|nr:hypothetical protein [Nanoarchaeota archaeon]MBU1703739.1 hypothetical protein [Nanoarchaeota archaeon]